MFHPRQTGNCPQPAQGGDAWREEDARLASVERDTGMPLQLLGSNREHVAQVDRVAGVALEVICRRVEHDAGAARLDRQVGGMDG